MKAPTNTHCETPFSPSSRATRSLTVASLAKRLWLQLMLLVMSCGFAAAAGFEINIAPEGSATVTTGDTKLINITYNWPSLTNTLAGATITIPVPVGYDQAAPAVTLLSTAHVASTNYNATTHLITYTMIDPLPAGASGTFQIGLRYPNGTTPNGTAIPITATSSATGQPSNTATTTLTASATDKVTVNKLIGAPPALDEKATYLIQVQNSKGSGNYNLSGTTVTDVLPAGIQFVSASNGGTYNAGTHSVTWTLGTVDVNTDVTLRVTVKFPTSGFTVGQNVPNTVDLAATLPNSQPATRTATISSTISLPNPLGGTQKWVSDSISSLKAYLTYYMSVANSGNVELSNYVLTDDFPPEFIPTTFYVGSDNNDAETAVIAVEYKTTLNATFATAPGSPFTAIPGSDLYVSASSLGLAPGEVVTGIRYTYSTLPVGYNTAMAQPCRRHRGKSDHRHLDRNGAVIAPLPRDPVTNVANFAYTFNGNTSTGTDPADTKIIAPTPKPTVKKYISRDSAQPTDTIHFNNDVTNGNGTLPLVEPVWADLLPGRTRLHPRHIHSHGRLRSLRPCQSHRSRRTTMAPDAHSFRYAATGVSLGAFTTGRVAFDTTVKAGTIVGPYSNTAYLVNTASPALNTEWVPPVADTNDLNGNGSTIDLIYPSNPNAVQYHPLCGHGFV